MEKRFYTVREFAELIGIGRTKAYKLCKTDPDLPVISIAGKLLIDREKLDKWLQQKQQNTVR